MKKTGSPQWHSDTEMPGALGMRDRDPVDSIHPSVIAGLDPRTSGLPVTPGICVVSAATGTRIRGSRSALIRHARAWPWHPRVEGRMTRAEARSTRRIFLFSAISAPPRAKLVDAKPKAWHDGLGLHRLRSESDTRELDPAIRENRIGPSTAKPSESEWLSARMGRRVKPGDDRKVEIRLPERPHLVRSDLSVPLCLCGKSSFAGVTRCC